MGSGGGWNLCGVGGARRRRRRRRRWYSNKQGGVSHCGLAIYIKKYLKAKKEELWKLKYFSKAIL
jgi:hypothetical protein